MKNDSKTNTILAITICFLIVIGVSKLMSVTLENVQVNKVIAETIYELPEKVNLNQTSNLLEDGYLIR
ncbi:hypothetical protein HOE31_00990 [bacterium]|jgi:hypothetical protein|nr:hypothetical protein [bacterium]MBT4121511.1 hypothetical protein [bacterium]MBT4334957.1 hypothetical protein [bacterium]MBT4495695.1 hypothetical protein [bacterium]MBT4763784.1 hypothetical protein [bacterium]